MGGLSHYLERAGLPTAGISLIRRHTEQIKPPRALAVDFELGRPFGAPNEPEFQRRVLEALLALFEAPEGPVLADFPDPPPGPPADLEGWSCPVNLAAADQDLGDHESRLKALCEEINLLRPWYDMAVAARGRTTYGISGLEPDEVARFVTDFIADQAIPSPRPGIGVGQLLKWATDDLKAYYFEAATARPGASSDVILADWLWGETVCGRLFLELAEICAASEDAMVLRLGDRSLVPHIQAHRRA